MLGAGGRKREEPQRVSLLSLQRPQKATFLLQPLRTPRGFLWDQKKPTHCRETPSIGGGIYPGPLSLGEYISAYSTLLIVSCGRGQERNNPNRRNYLQERPYIHCRQAYFTDCFPSVCPQLIFSLHLCSPNLQFTPVYQLPKALSVLDCALHCIVHIYCIGISLSHF